MYVYVCNIYVNFFYLAFKCAIKVRLKKCQLAGNNYGNAELSMPYNY